MSFIIFWFALPLAALALTGPVAALVFIAILKKESRTAIPIFWLALVIVTIIVGIFIAYTFSGFFPGPGCFVSLLTPLFAIVTFLSFHFRARRFYESAGDDQTRRRWFMAATLLIPLLQLSAPVVSFGYARACDALNRQAARPVIAALEKYKADAGVYPTFGSPFQSGLALLVPHYLSSIPPRACVLPFAQPDSYPVDDDWSLYYCNNNPGHETLLLVPIIGSDSQQIYNLNTGHWSAGSSLDGYCSYLR